jgi:hypothetical protein
MKLLIIQSSPASYYFLLCKYSPQHPVLKHPQFMFCREYLKFFVACTGCIVLLKIQATPF